MAREKTIAKKGSVKSGAKHSVDKDEVVPDLAKVKRPVEIDETEIFGIPVIDEKPEEDLQEIEDSDELSNEELVLDEEEINPFGDKWEE